MIDATIEDDGTITLLSPEEARRLNKLIGLTDVDQNFIRAINAGEITGDCIELDEDGNEVRGLPSPADSGIQIEPIDQPVVLPFSGPQSE